MARVLSAEVIGVSPESLVMSEAGGEVTYLLGPAVGESIAVFGARTDGSKWVVPEEVAAMVVATHRIASRDLWVCRFIQMAQEHGYEWAEPGREMVAHVAYADGTQVALIDPRTYTDLYGRGSAINDRWKYGIQVLTEGGVMLHQHVNVSGGCALALGALFLARYGGTPDIVTDRRITEDD